MSCSVALAAPPFPPPHSFSVACDACASSFKFSRKARVSTIIHCRTLLPLPLPLSLFLSLSLPLSLFHSLSPSLSLSLSLSFSLPLSTTGTGRGGASRPNANGGAWPMLQLGAHGYCFVRKHVSSQLFPWQSYEEYATIKVLGVKMPIHVPSATEGLLVTACDFPSTTTPHFFSRSFV